MMEREQDTINMYDVQTKQSIEKAIEAIKNNKSIIICGPERSGKTYIKNQIKNLLEDYDIYCGVHEYYYRNRTNGRHYNEKNFWIEETKENLISNIMEDYEFIRTTIQHNG